MAKALVLGRPPFAIVGLILWMTLYGAAWAQSSDCSADRAIYATLSNPSAHRLHKSEPVGVSRPSSFTKEQRANLNRFITDVVLRELDRGVSAAQIEEYVACVEGMPAIVAGRENLTNWSGRFPPATFFNKELNIAVSSIVIAPPGVMNSYLETVPLVQCFAKQTDKWALVGQFENDYAGRTVSLFRLGSPVSGENRILLASNRLGGGVPLEQVDVLRCDGEHFEVNWSRSGLPWGQVMVSKDGLTVTLTYAKAATEEPPSPMSRVIDVLHVTPQGLR